MGIIRFFNEDTPFKLPHPLKTKNWIKESISREKSHLKEINYIFCSDEYLLKLNKDYLNHTTYTDIITFDNSLEESFIEGEIYISIDRVRENAEKFNASFDEELHRVLIHGVLHLLGYKDKSIREKSLMRKKEDAYLSLRH
jgi:rRNA maturation RNase YbeY